MKSFEVSLYVPTERVWNLHWVWIQLYDYIETVWMLFTVHSVCTEWDLVNTKFEENDHSFHNISKLEKIAKKTFFQKNKTNLKEVAYLGVWE